MIWTGLLLLAFIIYHLLYFTARVTNPAISYFIDALAMIFLLLHLNHGIQSFVQTLGWNDDRTLPNVRRAGVIISVILFLGFVAIPFTVIIGILRG